MQLITAFQNIGDDERQILKRDCGFGIRDLDDFLKDLRLIFLSEFDTELFKVFGQRRLTAHLAQRVTVLARKAVGA